MKNMVPEVKFIADVMGVNKLKAMIGAYDFAYSNKDLFFQFKFKGCKKANICRITYDLGRDLFNMEFFKYGKNIPLKEMDRLNGLFTEDLIRIFEETTGLYIRI